MGGSMEVCYKKPERMRTGIRLRAGRPRRFGFWGMGVGAVVSYRRRHLSPGLPGRPGRLKAVLPATARRYFGPPPRGLTGLPENPEESAATSTTGGQHAPSTEGSPLVLGALLPQGDGHPPSGGAALKPSAGRTIDVPGTHATERQAPLPGGPVSSVTGKPAADAVAWT
jgi:hypothetical protein